VLAAAAAAMTFPSLPGGGFADLFTNRVFLAGFWAWFTAQTLKVLLLLPLLPSRLHCCCMSAYDTVSYKQAVDGAVCGFGTCDAARALLLVLNTAVGLAAVHVCLQIFTKRVKKGVWDIRAIVDSGGMPSSHSALCAVRQQQCGDGGQQQQQLSACSNLLCLLHLM
jgi:acid phosphatase family membrane protein YuiD